MENDVPGKIRELPLITSGSEMWKIQDQFVECNLLFSKNDSMGLK